jgi:CHAD domain-containing protein
VTEPLTRVTPAAVAVAGILAGEREVMRRTLPLVLAGPASAPEPPPAAPPSDPAADAVPIAVADPAHEALHDFRVAVRRSRTALGQLRSALPDGMRTSFRVPLKWIGDVTTPTRDHDVLIETLPALFAAADLAESGDALIRAFRDEREADRVALVEALTSPRYETLLAAWESAIAAVPWHPCPGKHAPTHAAKFAGRRARSLLRRFVREARRLDAESPNEAFHELRKTGKKLRYVIAFFQPVFAEGPIAELLLALKAIQDLLGRFNDLSVQRRLLRPHLTDTLGGAAATRLSETMAAEQQALREQFAAVFAELEREDNLAHLRSLLA